VTTPPQRRAGPKRALSEELRAELVHVPATADCDRLAELSGLFHTAGRLHLRGGGKVSVHLDLADPGVARRAFELLRRLGATSELRTYRQRSFGRPSRYQVHVDAAEGSHDVLRAAGVVGRRLTPLARPPRDVVRRSCCRRAYLRGALLGAGSLTGPPAPHLEIRFGEAAGAEFVVELAGREALTLRALDRVRHAVAYAKGAAEIEGILAAAGATDSVLVLEERAVLAATRSRANRLANADHANLVRATRAAHRQLHAARALERSGALAMLPSAVREAAELRLRHPSLSLRELAPKCRPPVTKAALHRRLRRVIELAERADGAATSEELLHPPLSGDPKAVNT
jgi:DNA-binding protein WhiA